jgi:hypothetical protein
LRSITIQTLTGPTTVPANLLRTAFGLRSTAITIGVLRLDRPSGPALYGSPLRLTGIARGLTSSRLSSSLDGVTWTSAAVLARGSTGGVSALVKPSQTIRYRLQATEAASPAQLVRVSPRVQLAPPLSPGVLSGTVRPRLVGADVTIERKTGTVWTEVARAVVDGTGAFSAVLDLLPGSYRARVAPSGGFTEGVAPAVTVSG